MSKTGRPKLQLDERLIKEMAAIGCTNTEIAAVLDCSPDTIRDNYSQLLISGRECGKRSVRRMLWAQGKNGNSVALRYLIHNVLKERLDDSKELALFSEEVKRMSDEELRALILKETEPKDESK